jgi:formiminotetrahydrofolate cyclodeaminase
MSPDDKSNIDLDKFIEDLASEKPVPGGGSVAALSGALGAALTTMVAKITLRKTDLDENFATELASIINSMQVAQERLMSMVEEDAEAYSSVLEAYKHPKDTAEEKTKRTKAIQAAFKHAADVPMKVIEESLSILGQTAVVVEKGSVNCLTDGAVAVYMLGAAVSGAALNVKINLKYIKDEEYVNSSQEKLKKLQQGSKEIILNANEIITKRFH